MQSGRTIAAAARRAGIEPRNVGIYTLILAYGGGLWQHIVHLYRGGYEHTLLSWLIDASLSLPLIALAAAAALWCSGRLCRPNGGRLERATLDTALLALFTTLIPLALGLWSLRGDPAAAGANPFVCSLLGAAETGASATLAALARDGLMIFAAHALVAGLAAALSAARASIQRRGFSGRGNPPWPSRRQVAHALCLALLVIGLLPGGAPAAQAADVAAAVAPVCDAGSAQRSYSVSAVNVLLPFNRWADIDPDGQIYVLDQDIAAVTHWAFPLGRHPGGGLDPALDPAGAENRRLRPRPLVLRANEGECVEVHFTNRLNVPAPVPPDAPRRPGPTRSARARTRACRSTSTPRCT